jgi:threonine/homoserine/homoserine lactone efflux protein
VIVADALVAAGLGVGLGVVTGIPIGVVNVAILDAAARGEKRFATGIGIGGAIADSIHAGLAFVGVGRLVEARPAWTQALAIAAAIVIVGYAVFGARRIVGTKPRAGSGVLTGLALTLPNPAPLAAWVAVAASVWPSISTPLAIVVAVGVGVGSAGWFTLLARWIAALPRDGRIVRVLPKIAMVVLVGVALVGVARVLLG